MGEKEREALTSFTTLRIAFLQHSVYLYVRTKTAFTLDQARSP